MKDKLRYPQAEALAIANELMALIGPEVNRIAIAGSLRRGKKTVADIELVYIPKLRLIPDLFGEPERVNTTDIFLQRLTEEGVLEKRHNVNGSLMWGPQNKLGKHARSGIPVDLFATNDECWWNYLVCRTGGAETNKQICMAAKAKGWKWHPYGNGFSTAGGIAIPVLQEDDVFRFVGLDYQLPTHRA